MKNIVKLTRLNKKRIAEMCVALLPRVGYARVTNSGILILKSSKWSLRRIKIPVTDVVMKYLPIYIGKLICDKKDLDVYINVFHDKVATIVSLMKYTDKMDLLDVIYKEFVTKCLLIPEQTEETIHFKEKIPKYSNNYNVCKDVNSIFSNNSKHSLYERIEKLRKKSDIVKNITGFLTVKLSIS